MYEFKRALSTVVYILQESRGGGGGGSKILPLRDLGKNISTFLEFSDYYTHFKQGISNDKNIYH